MQRGFIEENVFQQRRCNFRINNFTGLDIISELCGIFNDDQRAGFRFGKVAHSCYQSLGRRLDFRFIAGFRGDVFNARHNGVAAHFFQRGTQFRLENDDNSQHTDLIEVRQNKIQSTGADQCTQAPNRKN